MLCGPRRRCRALGAVAAARFLSICFASSGDRIGGRIIDSDIGWLRNAIQRVEERGRVDGEQCEAAELARLLRQCADLRALPEARRIHARMIASGIDGDCLLANLLIRVYGDCGCAQEARSAFAAIKQPRSIASWNLLLAACAKGGDRDAATEIFHEMPGKDARSWNFLIRAHASRDSLASARRTLDLMPQRNAISFTMLIAAHTHHGHLDRARELFDRMPDKDTVAWNSMLQAYARSRDLDAARQIFDSIEPKTLVTLTTMTRAYAREGRVDEAREIFDGIKRPDAIAWNIMIQGYCDTAQIDRARELFYRMPDPDEFTCSLMLSGLAAAGLVDEAKAIFDRARLDDPVAWNSMVMAFAHHGRVQEAKYLFDRRPDHHKRIASSWNSMIAAYARNGHRAEAAALLESIPPSIRNEISWNTLLAGQESLDDARHLFARIPQKSVLVANTMLCALAQTGQHAEEAVAVFDRIEDPNPASWAGIIGALAKAGRSREAIQRFRLMDLAGARPIEATYAAVLDACASSSSAGLRFGRIVHAAIDEFSCDDRGACSLENWIINMYGRCGSVRDAQLVFESMPAKNSVSWNVMLSAYAQNGHSAQVVEFFAAMLLEGDSPPTKLTLVSVLAACSQAGLLRDGLAFFASIRDDFGLDPHEDHYKCVVDLLGRTGQLEAAERFIERLPFKADDGVSFLSACSRHGSVQGGARAAMSIVDIDPADASPYVMLSNIHATVTAT